MKEIAKKKADLDKRLAHVIREELLQYEKEIGIFPSSLDIRINPNYEIGGRLHDLNVFVNSSFDFTDVLSKEFHENRAK